MIWMLVSIFLGIHAVNSAVRLRLRYWQRKLEQARHEQESLNSTIRWAYANGYRDAVNRLDIEIGMDIAVYDFHERFTHHDGVTS